MMEGDADGAQELEDRRKKLAAEMEKVNADLPAAKDAATKAKRLYIDNNGILAEVKNDSRRKAEIEERIAAFRGVREAYGRKSGGDRETAYGLAERRSAATNDRLDAESTGAKTRAFYKRYTVRDSERYERNEQATDNRGRQDAGRAVREGPDNQVADKGLPRGGDDRRGNLGRLQELLSKYNYADAGAVQTNDYAAFSAALEVARKENKYGQMVDGQSINELPQNRANVTPTM